MSIEILQDITLASDKYFSKVQIKRYMIAILCWIQKYHSLLWSQSKGLELAINPQRLL